MIVMIVLQHNIQTMLKHVQKSHVVNKNKGCSVAAIKYCARSNTEYTTSMKITQHNDNNNNMDDHD